MTAKTINVRLPEALYKQIEELAKATDRTKSFLAVDALTQYVKSESWQIQDIHKAIKEADAGEFATWPERVEECDFIVLACSLNGANRHMLNAGVFARVKRGVHCK